MLFRSFGRTVGNRLGIDEFAGVIGDDLGAPAVLAAEVAHQVVKSPTRAGRYRRRAVSIAQQLGEGGVFGDQIERCVHAGRTYARVGGLG